MIILEYMWYILQIYYGYIHSWCAWHLNSNIHQRAKVWGRYSFLMFYVLMKEESYADQGSIYLIKNTFQMIILYCVLIQQPSLQSSVSHDPSEIILICDSGPQNHS